jgi:hypothetical protein
MYKTIKLKTDIIAFLVVITKIPAIIDEAKRRYFKVGTTQKVSTPIPDLKPKKWKKIKILTHTYYYNYPKFRE